ncbi:hypothetical protein [Winogradskyella aurantia]|uniref:DUF304 domain-containing protein n=1 Tax=Winogradskyella aurantia TaxID=1915063 RepID=A0A265UTB8_9FLAO|nr:hypothetical protein [Winogradskyella aurantia]OZV68554.1 hypothetical protein CA834_08760 [Winogradskyella aurantia]
MRTDNRKVRNTVISIYFVLVIFAILLAAVFKSLDIYPDITWYIIIGFFVVMILFYAIARYFEYDSDGDKVYIINKGLILTEYINYRGKQVEFARQELVNFRINNYLVYKALVLTLKSKHGKLSKERFNVTLCKPKKLRYIRQSLRKIIKENKTHKQQG